MEPAIESDLLYGLEEKPPLLLWILFGLQHVLVAFAAMVGVPLALAAALGLPPQQTAVLVSGVMFAGGILCLIQSLGVGPFGGRLPLVNLATFKFIGPMVSAYQFGGFPALFGATFFGGFVEMALAFFAPVIRRMVTPFLIGAFLLIIGVSLLPIGVRNFFAIGQDYAGTPVALFVGLLTLVLIAVLTSRQHRRLRPVAVLSGILGGYVVAALAGLVNWAPVAESAWFGLASPFAFGWPSWPGTAAFVAIAIVYVVSFIETIGDSAAVATIARAEWTTHRLRGALLADGLSGPLGAVFNGLPMTTFGQNIGLVKLTGVASRFVVAMAGGILVLMGLVPKLATIISVMPQPVLGAALLMTFGMIAGEGIRRLAGEVDSARNLVVLTLGLTGAIGVSILPTDLIAALPGWLRPFLSDAMIAGLLLTVIGDAVLPGRTAPTATRSGAGEVAG